MLYVLLSLLSFHRRVQLSALLSSLTPCLFSVFGSSLQFLHSGLMIIAHPYLADDRLFMISVNQFTYITFTTCTVMPDERNVSLSNRDWAGFRVVVTWK